MKTLLTLLLIAFTHMASGSELRLTAVTQPLYLHGSESDPRISFESVPYITFGADPEWRFGAISVPFVPPAGGSAKSQDVNLTSLYHILVDGTYKKDSQDMLVTIDASKAIQPEGYPFTIEQVIDAVTTCVKIMYPPRPPDEGVLEIAVTRPKSKAGAKK